MSFIYWIKLLLFAKNSIVKVIRLSGMGASVMNFKKQSKEIAVTYEIVEVTHLEMTPS